MTRRTSGAVLACTLALAVCTPVRAQLAPPPTEADLVAQGAVRVRGEELAKLLKDATIDHTNLQSGQEIVMFYRADGTRFMKLGSGVRDTSWWIKDDLRCEKSVAGTGTVCQEIYRQGDTYRICTVGEPTCYWLATFTPGDVAHLAR
jgi:hypothetical protein